MIPFIKIPFTDPFVRLSDLPELQAAARFVELDAPFQLYPTAELRVLTDTERRDLVLAVCKLLAPS